MLKQTSNWSRSAGLLLLPLLASCSFDKLVRATDPDIIGIESVNSPSSANALRLGTLGRFNSATTGGESMFLYGGLFGDEFTTGDTFIQRIETDQRSLSPENANITGAYRGLHVPRIGAIQTREALTTFSPLAPAWNFSEMFFVEAYMLNLLAEHFCNGQPISYIVAGAEQYGEPLANEAIFTLALAKVDSGLTRLGATTGANETRVRSSLQILRARILLNQGNFAAVAATVAAVPTTFVWSQEHSLTSRTPGVWSLVNNQRRYIVSNNEGPLGLDFGGTDPRVPTCTAGQAACTAAGIATTANRPFDNATVAVPDMRYQLVWATDASSVALVSGLQARLFEAEALNRTGNFAGALTILNALRAAPPGYGRTIAAMPALADPGTEAGRRNLIFREKAFWLFGLGHRYGDMRRMMRQYGMTANEVFPNGTWQINRAPGYSTDVVFRTPTAETFNPLQPQSNGAATCLNLTP
ncbi:MAG: hypothetical protein V4617_12525 [Gemmatimonadota bacterium]